MDSSISVSQIRNHVNELLSLSERYSTLSKQSAEKFAKIIETAQEYRAKMDPLNTEMETLQVQKRNIQACYEKLNQIQTYRKVAKELEMTVERGPVESIQAYLNVLQRVQQAITFFKENSVDDVELARLQSLYSIGYRKVLDEFQSSLMSAFQAVDVEQLYNLVEKSSVNVESHQQGTDPMDEVALIEVAADPTIESLKLVINWQRSAHSYLAPNSLDGTKTCSFYYHECRREIVRSALIRLRRFIKTREEQIRPQRSGPVSKVARAGSKRPPGFVWDVATCRQLNEARTEDLNSEHLAMLLVALVKLMQNERRWLLRVQLTGSPTETQYSLDAILKITSNELLAECQNMIRLMQLAEKRADYHMVFSLLALLKKMALIGFELIDVLEGVNHILSGFNSLTYKLLQETSSTLKNFVSFLGRLPEHTTVNRSIVPPDATVHELTTNSFMFFENLLEFADVLSVAFRHEEVGSHGSSNVIAFLSENVYKNPQLGPHVGAFLSNSVSSLINHLDCKSGAYQEEIMQLIFQMNNLQYILKTIHQTDIHRYMLTYKSEVISSISSMLDDRRGRYTRACAVLMQLVSSVQMGRFENSTNRHLDSKDRAALKSIWQDFNSGLATLIRIHSTASLPDRDLRDALRKQLLEDLVPMYTELWERSKSIPFTTHRDKYMRCTVGEFQNKLKQLF